jgi:N-acyl-D-amino-acid deacylase
MALHFYRMKMKTSVMTIGLSCLLAHAGVAQQTDSVDLLIRNGRIMDGTGNSWYYGDVAVSDGVIRQIGRLATMPARKTIDAKGLIVCPGFIDVHAHIESSIFEKPSADNYIHDGVTSAVTGNCGNSAEDLGAFFGRIDSIRTSINIASLAGHNTIRRLGMGLGKRDPSAQEMQEMNRLMEKAMQDGAAGLSTGLIYLPGMYSKTAEIVSLASIAARFNGVYATHMRNEGLKVFEAIEEALAIGRGANIPVQISHFKVSGRVNWGKSSQTLYMVENARKEGIEVTIDQYPYTASSTNLATQVPEWALAGGLDSLRVRMKNPDTRKKIIDGMLDNQEEGKTKDFSFAVVANYAPDTTLNGKSITEINVLKGRKKKMRFEAETILDMLEKGNAQMVYHTMNENDLQHFIRYPFNMPAADGSVSNGRGMPHPRSYGTNARVLGRYVREMGVIGWEEAIRRMTSLPARKFGMENRGLLQPGYAADIVLLDPATVSDKATFEKPHQFSSGIPWVIVNGQVVIENGIHNGTRSGKSLRKKMPSAQP